MRFSIRKKTGLVIRKKLLISMLLVGYVVLLSTHSVFLPFNNGYIQSTIFYASHTNRELNADQYKSVTDKKNESVHIKINRHFDTEKLLFLIPFIIHCTVFNTPEYYFSFNKHNYFVSASLFTDKWRGPPYTA